MMEQHELLIKQVEEITGMVALEQETLHSRLTSFINELILHNFDELIRLLYRVDVSEQKLKQMLKENAATDAAPIIANLIIDRQLQKIKSRQEFGRDKNIIDDEEKW